MTSNRIDLKWVRWRQTGLITAESEVAWCQNEMTRAVSDVAWFQNGITRAVFDVAWCQNVITTALFDVAWCQNRFCLAGFLMSKRIVKLKVWSRLTSKRTDKICPFKNLFSNGVSSWDCSDHFWPPGGPADTPTDRQTQREKEADIKS